MRDPLFEFPRRSLSFSRAHAAVTFSPVGTVLPLGPGDGFSPFTVALFVLPSQPEAPASESCPSPRNTTPADQFFLTFVPLVAPSRQRTFEPGSAPITPFLVSWLPIPQRPFLEGRASASGPYEPPPTDPPPRAGSSPFPPPPFHCSFPTNFARDVVPFMFVLTERILFLTSRLPYLFAHVPSPITVVYNLSPRKLLLLGPPNHTLQLIFVRQFGVTFWRTPHFLKEFAKLRKTATRAAALTFSSSLAFPFLVSCFLVQRIAISHQT